MKTLLAVTTLALLCGCASFSDNVFRTEQTAVNIVYASYVAYTNALPQLHLTPDQSNAVKQARLKFAATVQTVETLRVSYETNSALKGPLEASMLAMIDQSSNICWTINYLKMNK